MNLLKNLLTIVAVVITRLVLRAFARLFWAVADPALQYIGEQLFRFASLSRGFRAFSSLHRSLRRSMITRPSDWPGTDYSPLGRN